MAYLSQTEKRLISNQSQGRKTICTLGRRNADLIIYICCCCSLRFPIMSRLERTLLLTQFMMEGRGTLKNMCDIGIKPMVQSPAFDDPRTASPSNMADKRVDAYLNYGLSPSFCCHGYMYVLCISGEKFRISFLCTASSVAQAFLLWPPLFEGD
jgi:hypothetical protein